MGRAGEDIWQRLSPGSQELAPARAVGRLIHALSGTLSERRQSCSTWFLRNQPLLLTIQDLLNTFQPGQLVRVCSVGCSSGAELYSILWAIRSVRPDLKLVPVGVDLSEEVIEKAKVGLYSRQDSELRAMTDETLSLLFEKQGDRFKVKDWIAQGVQWVAADARDPEFASRIGLQDLVLANNFLIHMTKVEAAFCMSRLVKLVKPNGLFVCRGVDLDIREKTVRKYGLTPVATRIEEIHDADPLLDARRDWPWRYWALEPLDRRRKDWIERYATIFQAPKSI
jgi:hypothetical protein